MKKCDGFDKMSRLASQRHFGAQTTQHQKFGGAEFLEHLLTNSRKCQLLLFHHSFLNTNHLDFKSDLSRSKQHDSLFKMVLIRPLGNTHKPSFLTLFGGSLSKFLEYSTLTPYPPTNTTPQLSLWDWRIGVR